MYRVDLCLYRKWIYRGIMFFVIVIGDIVIIVVLTGCFFVIRSRGRYRYYVNNSIYSKFESL